MTEIIDFPHDARCLFIALFNFIPLDNVLMRKKTALPVFGKFSVNDELQYRRYHSKFSALSSVFGPDS